MTLLTRSKPVALFIRPARRWQHYSRPVVMFSSVSVTWLIPSLCRWQHYSRPVVCSAVCLLPGLSRLCAGSNILAVLNRLQGKVFVAKLVQVVNFCVVLVKVALLIVDQRFKDALGGRIGIL